MIVEQWGKDRQENPNYSVGKRSLSIRHFVYQGHSALDRFFGCVKVYCHSTSIAIYF